MIGVCLQLFGFQQDNRGVNPHGIKVRLHGPTSNVPISQKRKPYTKFWNEPVKVESLEYEALIKACQEKFPNAEYITE